MEEVDVTGAVCPKPALIVRRCLEEMDAGDQLLVRGDYPPAERNLRRTCYKHGFEVTDPDRTDGAVPDHTRAGDTDGDADATDPPEEAFELLITVTEESSL